MTDLAISHFAMKLWPGVATDLTVAALVAPFFDCGTGLYFTPSQHWASTATFLDRLQKHGWVNTIVHRPSGDSVYTLTLSYSHYKVTHLTYGVENAPIAVCRAFVSIMEACARIGVKYGD